jgi:hypothetical protein
MVKFLRSLRYRLLETGKTTKYLKYAFGEIFLVVIGILLALQINNWNENIKNEKKARSYLLNLLEDLKADSLRLTTLKDNLEKAMLSKRSMEESFASNNYSSDSIAYHYKNTYNFVNDFVPNATTMEELKNSGDMKLISDSELRRKIVKLYNQYNDLNIKLQLGNEKAQKIMDYVSHRVFDVNNPSNTEVIELLNDPYFRNQIKMNYSYTQFNSISSAYAHCLETIGLLQNELDNRTTDDESYR